VKPRIVEVGEVDPRSLTANPRNWRAHPPEQMAALEEALDAVGWVAEVLVNRTSGRIVNGHARVELALARGWPTVPVSWCELTEEEEALALATFDALTAAAVPDREMLRALVAEAPASSPALAAMLAGMCAAPDARLVDEFLEVDCDGEGEFVCPACRYEWRGKAR